MAFVDWNPIKSWLGSGADEIVVFLPMQCINLDNEPRGLEKASWWMSRFFSEMMASRHDTQASQASRAWRFRPSEWREICKIHQVRFRMFQLLPWRCPMFDCRRLGCTASCSPANEAVQAYGGLAMWNQMLATLPAAVTRCTLDQTQMEIQHTAQ